MGTSSKPPPSLPPPMSLCSLALSLSLSLSLSLCSLAHSLSLSLCLSTTSLEKAHPGRHLGARHSARPTLELTSSAGRGYRYVEQRCLPPSLPACLSARSLALSLSLYHIAGKSAPGTAFGGGAQRVAYSRTDKQRRAWVRRAAPPRPRVSLLARSLARSLALCLSSKSLEKAHPGRHWGRGTAHSLLSN